MAVSTTSLVISASTKEDSIAFGKFAFATRSNTTSAGTDDARAEMGVVGKLADQDAMFKEEYSSSGGGSLGRGRAFHLWF